MKKVLSYLILCLSLMLVFSSCEEDESFDESLLIGKWVSGTEHYKFNSNHTGSTWDTSEDVTEEEADENQRFEWSLDNSELTLIHIMETGGYGIPKIYTITELTSTTLEYNDGSNSYSFSKE